MPIKKSAKLVRRAFTIRAEQDKKLSQIAAEIPGMDKSRVLRFALEVGLANLCKPESNGRRLLEGHPDLLITGVSVQAE